MRDLGFGYSAGFLEGVRLTVQWVERNSGFEPGLLVFPDHVEPHRADEEDRPPHTARQVAVRHWEIAPAEIEYLMVNMGSR